MKRAKEKVVVLIISVIKFVQAILFSDNMAYYIGSIKSLISTR